MKLIIPMARKSVKTSGFVPPSPLMSLAGKPILLRVLEIIKNVDISEIIFIVDKDSIELKKLVSKHFKTNVRYILQKNPRGVAHAIYGAKNYVSDESCLVLFADSIVDANIKNLDKIKEDVVIWTKQVDDPRNLGVVFIQDGLVTRLIEKPETPVSDLAMVGLYYFKNTKLLFESIAHLIKNKILNKGAFQITDALQIMINKDSKMISKEVKSWHDCGSKTKLLETHKAVIVEQKLASKSENTVFINPVFVEKGAKISNSIIGPNVSIGKNTKITRAIISDSIIGEDAFVDNDNLNTSLIGDNAKVHGSSKKINVKRGGVVRDE